MKAAAIALTILASGCNPQFFAGLGGGSGPRYTATAQAFHRLPAVPPSYAFLPVKEQSGDLEFETYKDMARAELTKIGWREVDRSAAKVLVAMDYLLDEGKPYTIDIPIFGQTGVSGSTTTGHVDRTGSFHGTTTFTPQFGITGVATRSYAQYRRRLYVLVFDSNAQVDGKPKLVFQGSAVSEGSTPYLAPVMPFLLNCLLSQVAEASGTVNEYRSR